MTDNTNVDSINLIGQDEINLLATLKAFCLGDKSKISLSKEEWMGVYSKSLGQSVETFVNEVIYEDDQIPEEILEGLAKECRKTVLKNYRLFAFGKLITKALEEEGIKNVILKGMAAASMYSIPELRKSGDIDILLLDEKDFEKSIKVLELKGLKKSEEQHANHHMVMSYDRITVEIHTCMVEEFDDKAMNVFQNKLMEDIEENVTRVNCMGYEIPALKEAYNAYELLVHMLQHFLREGFGLRLITDWYMFWKQNISEEEKSKYLRLVNESKIKRFSDVITLICIEYLGLEEEKVRFMDIDYTIAYKDYLADILKAGEFGILENDRMIALKDDSLSEYVRVFHKQMHYNFPKVGKVFIIWPILWIATLFIFLRNNKKIRNNNSGMSYLKKAKDRSALVKELHLFK